MGTISTAVLSIFGGVIGSVAKLYLDDWWKSRKNKLTEREMTLLTHMYNESGHAYFVIRRGIPPFFKNPIEDIDRPDLNFKFDDLGEVARLLDLGVIESIGESSEHRKYRITGKGFGKLKRP